METNTGPKETIRLAKFPLGVSNKPKTVPVRPDSHLGAQALFLCHEAPHRSLWDTR